MAVDVVPVDVVGVDVGAFAGVVAAKGAAKAAGGVACMVVFGERLGVDPTRHLVGFCARIVNVVGEQFGRRQAIGLAVEPGRRGIEAAELIFERGKVSPVGKIGLGDDDPVGDGDLLARFIVAPVLARTVDGIDGGDDVAEPEVVADHVFRHQGVDHRCRVRQTCCFDHQPPETRDLPALAARKQVLHRHRQIAANRTTEAPGLKQHGRFIDAFEQMMVEPDFADFVDQHRGVGHVGIAQQVLQ